eukprot:358619-Chlamydomonas_euryale.AAC.18
MRRLHASASPVASRPIARWPNAALGLKAGPGSFPSPCPPRLGRARPRPPAHLPARPASVSHPVCPAERFGSYPWSPSARRCARRDGGPRRRCGARPPATPAPLPPAQPPLARRRRRAAARRSTRATGCGAAMPT